MHSSLISRGVFFSLVKTSTPASIIISGLQMVINTKQYVSLPFDSESGSYTMGISTETNLVDQQRNVIEILPGYQTIVKVIPQLLGTTGPFNAMDAFSRQCKLPHETKGLNLIRSYTRIGCEYECAVAIAVKF